MTLSTKKYIISIGLFVAAILILFFTVQPNEKDGSGKVVDSGTTTDTSSLTSKLGESDPLVFADLSTCELVPEDVPNVPDGWTPHVFADSCIGIAFPVNETGSAFSAGEGEKNIWDGELLRFTSDDGNSRALDVLVIDESLYEHAPGRCSGYGYGTFPFCHDKIVSDWSPETEDGYTVYFPKEGQIVPAQFDRPELSFAAVITDDGRFITFHLYDGETKAARAALEATLKTLVMGQH